MHKLWSRLVNCSERTDSLYKVICIMLCAFTDNNVDSYGMYRTNIPYTESYDMYTDNCDLCVLDPPVFLITVIVTKILIVMAGKAVAKNQGHIRIQYSEITFFKTR